MELLDYNKLMARKPTLIGRMARARFFECPDNGDCAPLIIAYKGRCAYSTWYELPDDADYAEMEIDELMKTWK